MRGRLVWIEYGGRRRRRRDVILELHTAGWPVATIARELGIRYQIVYQTVHGARVSERMEGSRPEPRPTRDPRADTLILGCVSQKADHPLPARELYISELFHRRRAYAEASGARWWILSAEYGLIEPDRVIAPYDTRIGRRSRADKAAIARDAVAKLEVALGGLRGKTIEIHAGADYVAVVRPALRAAGALIQWPLEGLRFGEQLHWYGERLGLVARSAAPPEGTAGRGVRTPPPKRPVAKIGDGRGLARRITERFVAGDLDLSLRPTPPEPGWAGMPEVRAVEQLRRWGADGPTIRRFLTFWAAMERARDAYRVTEAALALASSSPWVFEPVAVAGRSVRDLADALRASGVSQRHSTDAYGWRMIAETLAEPALAPTIHAAIERGEGDAAVLFEELALESPAGTPRFPLLGGPKVGPLWIRCLAYPGGAHIVGLALVPIAVDVQVRRITENLGVTSTAGRSLEDVRALIQATWAADVEAHGAAGPDGLANTPGALDPALWFFARWGCTHCEEHGGALPISAICGECRRWTAADGDHADV